MKIYSVLLLTFLFVGFSYPPSDIQLKYEFNVGDKYVWVQNTKQTIKQTFGGMEQKTENLYDSEFIIKVAEVTGSGAKLEAVFTKLKSQTTSPLGNNNMDSNGPEDKMENKIFKSMLNKPFYIIVTKNGNVEKVEGSENLWSDFGGLGIEEQKQKVIKESLQMLLGQESLKSSFQAAFVPYPDKKVKAGEKWTVNNDINVNFPLAVQNIWSIESMTSTEAKLLADGTYTTTDKNKTINLPGGLKAKSDLAGQQAVKSTVNAKTGWPTNQALLVELKGKLTLLAGGMIPQDMDIPMEVLSETTYTISKK